VAKPTPPPPAPKSTDIFGPVHDFFASGTWVYVRNIGVFCLAVLWLGVLAWTVKDARRRIEDPVLVLVAAIIGAIPIFGTIVYLLVRPPEYSQDVRERRLEIDALEEQLALSSLECPTCGEHVGDDFLVCPVCVTRLKEPCAHCRAPLDPLWQACPRCAAPRGVEAPAPVVRAKARARSRRAKAEPALDEYLLDVARDVAQEPETAEHAPETV
jgi:hypothetical protein